MELNHLRIFYTLGKLKSYTQTAKSLCVTQPAISTAIKKLETSIGIALVHRKYKTIELTQAGSTLFDSCRIIFPEITKAEENIKQQKSILKKTIKIGCVVEFGNTVLIPHVSTYLKNNNTFHMEFLFSHNLEKPLIQEEVDLIIDCRNHNIPGFKEIYLFQEEYITIASKEFISYYSPIDLHSVPVISMDKKMKWWNNFLSNSSFSVEKFVNIILINHVRGMINASVNGMGIAFVPMYTVIEELKNKILFNPFPEIRPQADTFNIYVSEEKFELQNIRSFIDFLLKMKLPDFETDQSRGRQTV